MQVPKITIDKDESILAYRKLLKKRREYRKKTYETTENVESILKLFKKFVESREISDPLVNSEEVFNLWRKEQPKGTPQQIQQNQLVEELLNKHKSIPRKLVPVSGSNNEAFEAVWTQIESMVPGHRLAKACQWWFYRESLKRMRCILTYLFRSNIQFENPDNLQRALMMWDSKKTPELKEFVHSDEFGVEIMKLWSDPGVKQAYNEYHFTESSSMTRGRTNAVVNVGPSSRSMKRLSTFQAKDTNKTDSEPSIAVVQSAISTPELFMMLPRVMQEDYFPTEEDRKLIRSMTKNITEVGIPITHPRELVMRFVGIFRLSRTSYKISMQYFRESHACIFVADVRNEAALRQSLAKFSAFAGNKHIKSVPILVILLGYHDIRNNVIKEGASIDVGGIYGPLESAKFRKSADLKNCLFQLFKERINTGVACEVLIINLKQKDQLCITIMNQLLAFAQTQEAISLIDTVIM